MKSDPNMPIRDKPTSVTCPHGRKVTLPAGQGPQIHNGVCTCGQKVGSGK